MLRVFNKIHKIIYIASISILFNACSTNTINKPLAENSTEFIEAMLIQKSNEAIEAQQQYSMLIAENREQKNQKQNQFDSETIDIENFIGKPNIILKALANRYGYEYNEIGTNKSLPTITIDVKNQTPIEVLKMVSYQVDKVADIVLDKDAKIIRLIHRSR